MTTSQSITFSYYYTRWNNQYKNHECIKHSVTKSEVNVLVPATQNSLHFTNPQNLHPPVAGLQTGLSNAAFNQPTLTTNTGTSSSAGVTIRSGLALFRVL